MATAIFMPKNGMAMEEGTLVRWLKNVGDAVEINESIMEIETDKITMEAEAPATGIFLAALAQEGDVVPVLATMGWIGAAGEEIPGAEKPPVVAEAPQGQVTAQAPASDQQTANVPANTAMQGAATPYAKTLMKEKGIAPSVPVPTGKHGEIVAADVLLYAQTVAPQAPVQPAQSALQMPVPSAVVSQAVVPQTPADGVVSRVKLSGIRKVIAERMTKSYSEIPSVTQDTVIDVTRLLQIRERVNVGKTKETRISVNDFVLRAVALASVEYPAFRTQLWGDELMTFSQVHVGMAVSTDGGLIVPVLRNADQLTISAISAAAKDVAARARSNKLLPDEYVGSTITVSNLGMYGIASFTPIINQPNSAIVGVCAIQDELALNDRGEVYTKNILRICVTLDHRILDGAVAAQFALRVKELMENPLSLLI